MVIFHGYVSHNQRIDRRIHITCSAMQGTSNAPIDRSSPDIAEWHGAQPRYDGWTKNDMCKSVVGVNNALSGSLLMLVNITQDIDNSIMQTKVWQRYHNIIPIRKNDDKNIYHPFW